MYCMITSKGAGPRFFSGAELSTCEEGLDAFEYHAAVGDDGKQRPRSIFFQFTELLFPFRGGAA